MALIFDGNRLVIGSSLASMVAGHFNNEGAVFVYEHDNTGWVKTASSLLPTTTFTPTMATIAALAKPSP